MLLRELLGNILLGEVVAIMRKFFSEELLSEIHIKLDKQGLDGLSEKEVMVLNQEAIQGTIVDSTDFLGAKIDNETEQLSAKIDNVGAKVDNVGVKVDNVGAKVDDAKEQLSAKMDDMTEQLSEKMGDMTEQLSAKIDGVVKEIGIKIDGAVGPVHQELRNFRLWTKLVVAGLWAVVASLIASLIFKIFWG